MAKDPCTITGSFDVVLAVPTDSTPAALVTGEGNAWSHPHDSEIELDAFLDDAYANGNWVDEGTPLTPTSLEFDGAATVVNCGSGATLDDLPDGAEFTVGAWIRADGWGEANLGRILDKSNVATVGWTFYVASGSGLFATIKAADADAYSYTGVDEFTPDSQWHFVVMYYDDTAGAGLRKIYLAIDGKWSPSYIAQVSADGAYTSDAATSLYIGNRSNVTTTFDGAIGWAEISDNDRYTHGVTFVPPARTNPPTPDINTIEQWNFTDGAGAAVTALVTSPANDGAITAGAGGWLVTHDMAQDAPGERVYHAGYVFGCDAADEGFKQVVAGLAAGSNYVFRVPVNYGADSRGQPKIVVWDETNGAAITTFLGPKKTGLHSGGNNSATLICATGKFPQHLVGTTLYNITDGSKTVVTAVSGNMTTITGVLAGGTDNDWDTNDVFRIVRTGGFSKRPWCETFTCELPTIARNGVVADCVSASVQGLNASAEGTLMWHEIEWLAVLDDEPSLETFTGANPDIPNGWTNVDLDAGDSEAENTVVHSGAASMQFNVGASAEGIRQQITAAIGAFVQVGLWSYGDGSAGFTIGGLDATQLRTQYSATVFNVATPHTAVWRYTTAVFRVVAANPSIYILADAGAAGARYIDDVVVTVSNPVSLTATPRSLANSVELGGLSIDGRDTCTQPTGRLTRTHGEIRFSAIPRHDMDEVGEWGQAGPHEYLFDLRPSGANRLILWRDNTPRLTLFIESNAVSTTANWNTAWAASTKWDFIIKWNPARVWGLVNGIERFSFAWASVFTADPATVYFGSDYNGTRQFDGVILPG